ncbi:MAG: hypothetical protein GC159_12725 [Phycisphaera sp.]|nr:hypothetical protein [Phycisphaera sp.]
MNRRSCVLVLALVGAVGLGFAVTPEAHAGGRTSVSFGYHGDSHGHSGISFGIGFNSSSHGRYYDRGCYAPSYYHSYSYSRSYCPPTYYRSYTYCPPPVTRVYYTPAPTRVVYVDPAPAPVTHCVIKVYPGSTTRYCTTHRYGDPACDLCSSAATTQVYTTSAPVVETARTYVYSYNDEAPAKAVPQPTVADDGWAALKYGDAHDAAAAFAQEAEQYPSRGLPRIGCAIAKSNVGDDNAAVFAMRTAVKLDAASLDRVPIDQPLRDKCALMIARYRDKTQYTCSKTDALFMAAATHYVLGEYANANSAIRAAIDGGHDNSESAAVLARMIDTRLNGAYQYRYEN